MGLKVQERYRLKTGPMASDSSYGNNGFFMVPTFDCSGTLAVMVGEGDGWDHVSVSLPNRCPTWDEMEYIRRMFFDDEDLVVQFSPPRSKYINKCKTCLHMWRKHDGQFELPPSWMVA